MDRGDAAVTRVALTIAGSDSGGGAGVEADLKTFAALGVHGCVAITAITAQNTRGVRALEALSPGIVAAQIEAVFEDFDVGAVKIGMLASPDIAAVVAERLAARPAHPFVVFDPVMAASAGGALARAGLLEAARAALPPVVDCLTPNLGEAAAWLGDGLAATEADMRRQGEALLRLGFRAVLMKGGHLDGDAAVDWLILPGAAHRFAAPRLPSPNLHGTGCTLSSAVAAHVARGFDLVEAVRRAKAFVRDAIVRGRGAKLGQGAGPLLQLDLAPD